MSTLPLPAGPRTRGSLGQDGVRISADGLTVRHRNGTTALDDVTLTIEPGRLTAVIGPSGSGKSTLLNALAGIAPTPRGSVVLDTSATGGHAGVGFVPQEDILHPDLPLRRTLRYAAALRMAVPAPEIDSAVSHALEALGLERHGETLVRQLSGGQRKRASIACEILTRPHTCFLDEPTSGLDPAVAGDLIDHLRVMADEGSTVVFTTHSVEDVVRSDHVVALGTGGRVVATGTPDEVLAHVGVDTFAQLYERLRLVVPERRATTKAPGAVPRSSRRRQVHGTRPSALRQWWVLSRRATDILVRNRLTLAILLGSPAAVIAMFGVLFRPGGFDPGVGDPTSAVQVAYWLSFAGFFFGLTFGLLQICTEVPVLQRERHAGVRTGAYLMSKLTVLTPVLLGVNAAMLVVLRTLDRIPSLSAVPLSQLYLVMMLNTMAALCLGLLASALVNSVAQAALALPMLCFPAVLFSGAMVPMPVMTGTGRAIGALMADRWAFEGIARILRVAALTPRHSPFAGLGSSSQAVYAGLLLAFIAVLGCAALVAAVRRADSPAR